MINFNSGHAPRDISSRSLYADRLSACRSMARSSTAPLSHLVPQDVVKVAGKLDANLFGVENPDCSVDLGCGLCTFVSMVNHSDMCSTPPCSFVC
jgi:hypothetical protein